MTLKKAKQNKSWSQREYKYEGKKHRTLQSATTRHPSAQERTLQSWPSMLVAEGKGAGSRRPAGAIPAHPTHYCALW